MEYEAKKLFRRVLALAIESRHTGRIVLVLGVLVLVIVLAVALSGSGAIKSKDGDPKIVQNLQKDLESSTALKAPPPKAEPKKDLYFKRQPRLSREDVQGSWEASIGRYTAVLQLQGNTYQIIFAETGNAKRLYSAGVYAMGEDILLLTPRLDWADPSSRGGARVPYEILTRAPFPVIASIMSGKMVWQNPPPNEKRIIRPNKTPVAAGQDVNYIVWQKLK